MSVDDTKGPIATPKTAKGNRTREHVKQTARQVFAKVGYRDARIADITHEANVASGTFYRYFRDKDAILWDVLGDLLQDVVSEARESWDPQDPLRSVRATTEKYLTFYQENADLYALLIEVAQYEPAIETMWAQARDTFYARIERMLQRAETEELLHPDIDPAAIAPLLGGMTEYYAYLVFVLRRIDEASIPRIADQVVAIWSHGVFDLDRRAASE